LEAMAKERYAGFLFKENDVALGNEYLTSSYWRYRDWGADFKALCLSQKYEFLKRSKRNVDTKSLTDTTAKCPESNPSQVTKHAFSFNSTFRTSTIATPQSQVRS